MLQPRSKHHLGIVLALLALAAVGCARPRLSYRELQQPKEPPPRPPEMILSGRQVTEDVDLVSYAMERGYGGRAFVPERSWDQLRKRLALLRGRGSTVERFCDELADALWQLPDGHLSAYRESIADGSYRKCGTLFKQIERKATVGQNYAAEEKGKAWRVDSVSSGGAKLGIIAIKDLPLNADPAWRGYDEATAALLDSDGILIDLRGNGGGDDSRAYQLASQLIDEPIESTMIRIAQRQTPESLTLRMNSLDRMDRQADGARFPHVAKLYDEFQKRRTEAVGSSRQQYEVVELKPFVRRLGPHAFRGRVAILVDAECASSCETGLRALRYHPRARVFGQRTGGFLDFGEVGPLTLPNSGIRTFIPTKHFEYESGQFYDKVGLAPDVDVPDGANAFDPAIAWLRREVEKAQH
jgi:hypothetical protein